MRSCETDTTCSSLYKRKRAGTEVRSEFQDDFEMEAHDSPMEAEKTASYIVST